MSTDSDIALAAAQAAAGSSTTASEAASAAALALAQTRTLSEIDTADDAVALLVRPGVEGPQTKNALASSISSAGVVRDSVVAVVGDESTVVAAAEAAVSAVASTRSLQPVLFYARGATTTAAANLSGTPAYTGGSLSGGALTVEVPVLDLLHDGTNLTDGCVEALVTITGNPPATRTIANKVGGYLIGCGSNGRAVALVDYPTSVYTITNPTGIVITDGAEHHVALVISSGAAYLFVDGVLQNSDAGPHPVDTADKTLNLGATVSGSGTWPGSINALRVSDSARYSLDGFTAPTTFALDPLALLVAQFTDNVIDLTVDGPTAYPARPTATSVKWIGPYEPAAMALYDEWIQVAL